jgi:hypothetical protein
MRDPEQIKRFTRGAAMMKDPPWLPMALWMAVVPALVQFGVLAPVWLSTLAAAVVATALGSRWFKRTYGVVTPSPESFAGLTRVGGGFLIVVAVWTLEWLSSAVRSPVRLGFVAFGAWLAWGAHISEGVRRHLYVLAAICGGLAFLPLVFGRSMVCTADSMAGSIVLIAFGLGWAYVCIQDYRVLRRSLRHVQR